MSNQETSSGRGAKIVLILLATGVAAVMFCGVLASIAIPAFISYVKRSKTSEATANLRIMYVEASAYYYEPRSSGLQSCTVDPARTSNTPSNTKTALSWDAEAPSFAALGFNSPQPLYYQYEIVGAPGRCGNQPNSNVYSLRAHGDLDADGQQSLFELAVGSDANNELHRAPGIYQENELE